MTPTYGNTLMGLAASVPLQPEDQFSITYYAPQPRAVLRIVDPKDTAVTKGYGKIENLRAQPMISSLRVVSISKAPSNETPVLFTPSSMWRRLRASPGLTSYRPYMYSTEPSHVPPQSLQGLQALRISLGL